MSTVDDIKAEAADIRHFAICKLDWSRNPAVQKRYSGVPQTLEDIVRRAENCMRAAARLEHYASVLEARASA